MKKVINLYLLALILFACSCVKSSNVDPSTSAPAPIGSFSGVFKSLHKRTTGVVDTLKANITLTTTLAGLYKVTGDTTSLHAGSHGAFQLNSTYISFLDSTANSSRNKIHLTGLYQYLYDGSSRFQIAVSNDTLAYYYDLKKN